MTSKEKYWKNGNIFHMSDGSYKMVWGDRLIDKSGYIDKANFNGELVNTDSTVNEHVIEVFPPCPNPGYLGEFLCPNGEAIWSPYQKIYRLIDLKKELGLNEDTSIFIIQ